MSKFCLHCGVEIGENTAFCDKCGAQQGTATPVDMNNTAPVGMPAIQKKSKLPLIIVLSVIAVILLALVYFIFIRNTCTEPIDKYFEAIENEDAELMIECYHEDIREAQFEFEYKTGYIDSYEYDEDDYEDYWIDEYEHEIEYFLENEEIEDCVGKGYSVSYEILDKSELPEKSIDEEIEDYESHYDIKLDIEEGYSLCVRINYEGDDEECSLFRTYSVLKIDGKWYFA